MKHLLTNILEHLKCRTVDTLLPVSLFLNLRDTLAGNVYSIGFFELRKVIVPFLSRKTYPVIVLKYKNWNTEDVALRVIISGIQKSVHTA